jgi:hypothetical protein
MSARVLAVWFAFVATACVGGTEDLRGGSRDAGVVTPPPPPPPPPPPDASVEIETSVFDPGAEVVFDPPAIIFEPSDGSSRLQGALFDLVWTGERYLFAWIQNTRDGLQVFSSAIDPATGRASPIETLSADYEDFEQAPESVSIAWNGRAAAVFWPTGQEIRMLELDAFGARAGMERGVWTHGFEFAPSITAHARERGYFVTASRYVNGTLVSTLLDLDENGAQQGDTTLFDFAGASAITPGDTLAVLWAARQAGGPDHVYLSQVIPGSQLPPRAEIYTADSASPVFIGGNPAPRIAAIWDFDAGTQLVDVIAGSDPITIAPPGYNKPVVVHDPSNARIALVHEAGVYRDTNPLPNRIEAQAFDYVDGERSEPVVVYDGAPGGECLERVRATLNGDRLGVGWVMGCSTRVLRFVELRGVRR